MTPDANDLCVFAIKRGSIERRIDPHFYLPTFQSIINEIKKNAYVHLGDIAHFSKETTDYTEFVSGVFDYLEISGVSLGINKYKTTKIKVSEAPSRAKMKTQIGDIAVALTRPHRGAVTTIKQSGIIASTGFSVIRDVDPKINREWLIYVLLSDLSLKQMLQRSSGGNYPAIIEDELKRILIPKIELPKQIQMTGELQKALSANNKKAEIATKMTVSFQQSVMEKYSLCNFQRKKLYTAVRYKDLDGVIDAKRYMNRKGTPSMVLSSVCEILEDKTNVSKYATDTVDWIRIDDVPNNPIDIEDVRTVAASEMEGTFFEVKQNDILVARLGPTILNQKIVLVRNVERTTLASAEFLVLRCKDGYNPEAVMAILKTDYYRDLMYSRSRGSTPSRYRLNREDALNLPFPDIRDSQELLAREALRVRNEVLQLRREASDEWAEAKAQFEKELLGE